MDEIHLSKNASFLLRALHKFYKKKCKRGENKETARIFSGSDEIQNCIMPEWSFSDISDACWELHNAGLLYCLLGDDGVEMALLTSEGIAYAENRFVGLLKAAWNLLKEIIPFIPSGC